MNTAADGFDGIYCVYCGSARGVGRELIAGSTREIKTIQSAVPIDIRFPMAAICSVCIEVASSLAIKVLDPSFYCHLCGQPSAECAALFVGKMLSVCSECIGQAQEFLEAERIASWEKVTEEL